MNPDHAFESWLENLKPGDRIVYDDGTALHGGELLYIIEDISLWILLDDADEPISCTVEDVMPPEDTPFHKWAAAQGNEDVSAWWEVKCTP